MQAIRIYLKYKKSILISLTYSMLLVYMAGVLFKRDPDFSSHFVVKT